MLGIMGKARVKVDEQGRIYLPVELRREAHVEEGAFVEAHVEEGHLVIERTEPVAERGRGAFRAPPLSAEEIDEKTEEYTQKEADA
ncbi:MAG: hypothetical protein MAG715_00605 [Methanonatronarchaeales archaeon]|nr:hypothetical protein [Methanonatronarchaeales archaeon]